MFTDKMITLNNYVDTSSDIQNLFKQVHSRLGSTRAMLLSARSPSPWALRPPASSEPFPTRLQGLGPRLCASSSRRVAFGCPYASKTRRCATRRVMSARRVMSEGELQALWRSLLVSLLQSPISVGVDTSTEECWDLFTLARSSRPGPEYMNRGVGGDSLLCPLASSHSAERSISCGHIATPDYFCYLRVGSQRQKVLAPRWIS
jgi:hypothetical protein